jgi:type IV pilus assembly protein PilX
MANSIFSRKNSMAHKGYLYQKLAMKERGVVLFVALIVLVAMSLAAVGMMRAVDTNTLVAGNIAFRQSALAAAERAFEIALAQTKVMADNGGQNTNNSANGYFALSQNPYSLRDLPWANAKDLGIDSETGNRVVVLISRLSDGSGNNQNVVGEHNDADGDSVANPGSGYRVHYDQYRIIARVTDSKNLVTFIEEKIY